MDTQIKSYVFNKTLKSIAFTEYTSIRRDSIRMIANVTAGIIIYNYADPLKGGTVLGNVLTLEYDTAAMNDLDDLQIVYNTDDLHASQAKQDEIIDAITNKDLMITISNLIRAIQYPAYLDRGANQIRAQITGAPSTVAVSSIANQVLIDSYQGKLQVVGINLTAWSTTVRTLIT